MAGVDVRVQLLRAGSSDDGFAEVPGDYVPLGVARWMRKTDISDAERWRADEIGAVITTRFTCASTTFTRAITPKDRLQCGSVTYDIQGIKEVVTNFRLEITANARADK